MNKFSLKYGIGIAITLILYFLLSKAIGLHKYPVLSALNGVIYGGGILIAMIGFKRSTVQFKYQEGFQVGLFCGVIATLLFVSFMAVYLFMLDTGFAAGTLDSWGLSYNKGALMVLVTIAMMGFSTSLVLTLAFMQLLKESWNTSQAA